MADREVHISTSHGETVGSKVEVPLVSGSEDMGNSVVLKVRMIESFRDNRLQQFVTTNWQ